YLEGRTVFVLPLLLSSIQKVMKTKKSKTPGKRIELTTPATEPDNGLPKYYLADVPQNLRARVLDLCTRRYYHQALELLQMHSITRYTYEDLLSFYDWAPATLPPGEARRGVPSSSSVEPCDYSQPLPELLADIRSRLDSVPPD